MPGSETRQVTLFYSYAHRDEKHRQRLQNHLSPLRREGLLAEWHDREITAGKDFEKEIYQHLESADIILLLVSADFVASDFCWGKEMARALRRHRDGHARVIPVIVQPVDWSGAPFKGFEALPKDGKPVTLWSNKEAAWLDVVKGIRKAAAEIAKGMMAAAPPLAAAQPLPHSGRLP